MYKAFFPFEEYLVPFGSLFHHYPSPNAESPFQQVQGSTNLNGRIQNAKRLHSYYIHCLSVFVMVGPQKFYQNLAMERMDLHQAHKKV